MNFICERCGKKFDRDRGSRAKKCIDCRYRKPRWYEKEISQGKNK